MKIKHIFKTYPKICIAFAIVLGVVLAITATIILLAFINKKADDTSFSSVTSKPTIQPVLNQESSIEETISEPANEIRYNNKVISVPKIEVAKIDSKEDPSNSPMAAEQPAIQPETKDDIIIDCFESVAYGIDVSSHQGDIDWARVKASGVEFAMIRCGYRGYETGKIVLDAKFEHNILNAYKNGIKIGIYFYSSATSTDEAVQEAAWVDMLLKEQQKKGIRITYPVAYDFEEFGSHSTSRANNLSKEQVTNNAIAFLDYLSNMGYKVMHYSCKNWMLNKWDAQKLSKYDFWLAHYCEATDYKGAYVMWQYTSKGKVDGISGNVDLDISGIKSSESNGQASFVVCEKKDVLAYSAPRSDASVVFTLNTDTIYDCLKTYEKDWSELFIDGKYVYVKDSDIKTVEFTKSNNEYKTADNISYYSKCIDKEANIAGTIEKDTKLNVAGIYKNLWLKITYDNNTFYVKYIDVIEIENKDDTSSESSSEESSSGESVTSSSESTSSTEDNSSSTE